MIAGDSRSIVVFISQLQLSLQIRRSTTRTVYVYFVNSRRSLTSVTMLRVTGNIHIIIVIPVFAVKENFTFFFYRVFNDDVI